MGEKKPLLLKRRLTLLAGPWKWKQRLVFLPLNRGLFKERSKYGRVEGG